MATWIFTSGTYLSLWAGEGSTSANRRPGGFSSLGFSSFLLNLIIYHFAVPLLSFALVYDSLIVCILDPTSRINQFIRPRPTPSEYDKWRQKRSGGRKASNPITAIIRVRWWPAEVMAMPKQCFKSEIHAHKAYGRYSIKQSKQITADDGTTHVNRDITHLVSYPWRKGRW